MIETILAIIAVGLAILYWINSKPKNAPPGPPSLPILGSIPFLSKQLHLGGLEMQKKYGDTYSFMFGSKFMVFISNYETMKKVFGDETTAGRDQHVVGGASLKRNGIMHGVILSQNYLWKEHRRFALSTLRDFGMGKSWLEDAVQEEVDDLCERITKQEGTPFDPKTLFSCSVANVICALIFGKRFSHEDEKFAMFSTLTNEAIRDLEKVSILDGIPWLKYVWPSMRRILDDVERKQDAFMDYLSERIDEHEAKLESHDANKSFIDAYQQQAKQKQDANEESSFTRFQLLCTLNDLFGAGSETTSTTLLWALLLLIENPDVLKKVKAEMDGQIEKGQTIRMGDRVILPYTEATTMEIMRVASLVPINVPHMALNDMTIDGFNIPKGTTLLTNNYFIHRDPRYWKNPDRFDPTRFLDKDGKVFRPDGFVPFSVGKRACLGESLAKMEMWLFFANLVHRFDFRLPEGSTATSKDCIFALILSPTPFEVVFKKAK